MYWLDSLWHLALSTFSIANVIGIIAVLIAIFEPPILSLVTDLRKWCIVVAVCAFGYSAVFTKGYEYGLSVKEAQWHSAEKNQLGKGEAARRDAESDAAAGKLPDNRDDRDNP